MIFVCSAMAVLFDVSSNIISETLCICPSQAPNVPTVAAAMKKARDIVQYFNKSTQATKKLKDQQRGSSLPKYSGQPKNILQDVVTRWWSTYRMLKRLPFLREAISHYFVNNPNEADTMTITAHEWKIYYQIEVALKTMGFWQRVLEGEKYVNGSLVPVATYTIRQSFLQVIASEATKDVVKVLTRLLLNDFDWRYHPTTQGQLKYEREALVGHGNRYISIHPYFFKAAFLDPRTHHFLREIMEADNFNQVC